MAKSSHKVNLSKPENAFKKPLRADFKDLFKALSQGIGHTAIGKWEELGTDTVEALSAIGLTTEPGELAFLLIRRAITRALFELVGESAGLQFVESYRDSSSLLETLDFSISEKEIYIDQKFLERPSDLPLIQELQSLLGGWLQGLGLNPATATSITTRLPGYFVFALNQEWRRNAKSYRPLVEAIDTPFTKAGDRERAWNEYSAFLERRANEGVFDEPFGLKQIYVPLNAL